MGTLSRLGTAAKEAALLVLNPRFVGPCLAGLFCLAVATVVGVSYLFTMAMAILALPVASYIVQTAILRGCSATRERWLVATQGERTAAAVRISSARGPLPHGLTARDNLPPLVEADSPEGIEVPNGNDVEVRIWLRPKKRGRYVIGPTEISTWDPFGMFRLKRHLGATSELVVYPRPIPVRVGRISRRLGEPGTAETTGRIAARGDFAGVRDWRHGDELRRVHWKTTARTGRLAVVEFEDSAGELATVALDLSRGSDIGHGPVTSLDIAAGVAAYAVREHLRARRPVRLLLPHGSDIMRLELASSMDLTKGLAALADARAGASVSAGDLLKSSARDGSVLLIVSRSDGGLAGAVREVAARGTEVSIALIDPEASNPRSPVAQAAAELERAGAEVEVVREAERL